MNKVNVLNTFTIGLSDSLPHVDIKDIEMSSTHYLSSDKSSSDKSFMIKNLLESNTELNDIEISNVIFLKRRKIESTINCIAHKISIPAYYDEYDDNEYELKFGCYIDLIPGFRNWQRDYLDKYKKTKM